MRKFLTVCVSILFLVAAAAAFAGNDGVKRDLSAGETGKVLFKSAARNTTLAELLTGRVRMTDTVSGELAIPEGAGAGRLPAMVVMHGSSGVEAGSSRDWAAFLNHLGIATFIVDSFSPRGIGNTATDQSLLSYTATTLDGFRALQMLATHPRIDPARIGIIGFSRGGYGAQTTAFERFRAAAVPGGLKYALHVALYGGCSLYGRTTGSPILHLIGDKDDYSDIAHCRANTALLAKKGADIRMVEYPGALHGFDVDRPVRYLPRNQTWRGFAAQTDLDTLKSYLPGEGREMSLIELNAYRKACVAYGVNYGGDRQALEDARRQVREFVVRRFHLEGKATPDGGKE